MRGYVWVMRNYRELIAWKKGVELSLMVYKLTKDLPWDEDLGLKSQMRRASVSIPSNLSEGASRRTNKDFCRFVRISLGSCSELETQLEIMKGYYSIDTTEEFKNLHLEVRKLLIGLIKSLTDQ